MLKDVLKKYLYVFALTVVVFAGILSAFIIVRPVTRNMIKNDKVLTLSAIGDKNKDSLGTDIRITGIIINDSSALELSKIKLSDDWSYFAEPEMVAVYNKNQKSSLEILLHDVYSVKLQLVKANGGGLLEVGLNNRTKVIDCYENSDWSMINLETYSNTLIYPERNIGFLVCLFLACWIVMLLLFHMLEDKNKGLLDKLCNNGIILAKTLAASAAAVISSEMILRGGITTAFQWMSESKSEAALSILFVWLLINALVLICGREFLGIFFGSGAILILALVNTFKIQYRGTPVTPWDIQLFSVAMSVLQDFEIRPTRIMAIGIGIFICVILVSYFTRRRWIAAFKVRVILAIFLVSIVTGHIQLTYLNNTSEVNLYQLDQFYLDNGITNSFLRLCKYLKPMKEPESYTANALKEAEVEIKRGGSITTKETPNILVILGESFWDINRIADLIMGENPLSNLYALKEETIYGEALVNVFGGGTVNSEWEVLTGFNSIFLPQEYMPYQNCVKDGGFSVVRLLQEKGYRSFAIHPYLESNYNRSQAYINMGIEKFLSEKDFDGNAERIRGYISDNEVYHRALQEGLKLGNEPWLGVIVTMENHGGYGWDAEQTEQLMKDYPLNLKLDQYSDNQKKAIYDMACGLKSKDAALNTLIEAFREYDKPTVIIYFGDHMADALRDGKSFLDESNLYDKTDLLEKTYEQSRTPFFIWSNYDHKSKDVGLVSLSSILPIAFDEYGLEKPLFWDYLLEMRDHAGVRAKGIYVDHDGTIYNKEDISAESQKYFDNYELLQYDQLFGKNYYSDWFTTK